MDIKIVRLFISLPVPETYRDAFGEWQHECIRRHEEVTGQLRWTQREQLHLTARFLGDVDDQRISALEQAFATVCRVTPPFELIFEKLVYAPPAARSFSMIRALFKDSEPLRIFSDAIAVSCREMFSEDRVTVKELIPHITLARINISSQNFGRHAGNISLNQPPISELFPAASCTSCNQ